MDDYSTLNTHRTIAALYDDNDQAESARRELADAGFTSVDLTRNTDEPSDEARPVHEHSFWSKVKDFFAGDNDAHIYGEGVRRGGTLVTVHTSDGLADEAIAVLDRHDPANLEDSEDTWRSQGWQGGAHTAVDGDTDIVNAPTITDFDSQENEALSDRDNAPAADLGQASSLSDSGQDAWSGKRDIDRGNGRVRSYFRNATFEQAGLTQTAGEVGSNGVYPSPTESPFDPFQEPILDPTRIDDATATEQDTQLPAAKDADISDDSEAIGLPEQNADHKSEKDGESF